MTCHMKKGKRSFGLAVTTAMFKIIFYRSVHLHHASKGLKNLRFLTV